MRNKTDGIFYGWFIVGAAFITLFLTTGIGFYSFSVFLIPLERSFGASRTAIAGVNSVVALVAGFAAPVIGILMDRWGPRQVVGLGAILTGSAYLLLSRSSEVWHLYVLGLLLGTGLTATTLIPSQTLVSHWFVRRRGTAMGIVMVGVAFGGIVFAPLAHYLIEQLHWRSTCAIFGVVIPAVIVPLAYCVIRRSPAEMGLRPDGGPEVPVETGQPRDDAGDCGLTVAQAVRTASFWHLFFVQLFMAMGFTVITAHIVGIVVDSTFGLSVGEDTARLIGARTTSYFLAVSIAGRLLGGYLAERFSKRHVMVGEYVALIVAALTLCRLDSATMLYMFVFFYGMGLGAAVVYPLLVAENFGLTSFSKLVGIMGIPFTIGAAVGVVGAATVFDMTESYANVFMILMCLFATCSVLTMLAKPPSASDSGTV
jgi:MFS family permease